MNSERQKPYVGISGVVSPDQQSYYEEVFDDARLGSVRKLLLGVKAVHSTQWCDMPNKYGSNWYPVGADDFYHALWPKYVSNGDEMGVAQMYLDPTMIAQDPMYPRQFVDRVIERGEQWLTHIQFDMLPFHEPASGKWYELIEHIRNNGIGVIVQCHQPAMALGISSALAALRRLPPLDYVLFDASHGTGKRLDTEGLLPFLQAAYSDTDLMAQRTNFGIAGGLCGAIVDEDIPRVISSFPDISWDAEGRLHFPWEGDCDSRGLLNDQEVSRYLHASGRIVNRQSE
jgi:hypothetical protein